MTRIESLDHPDPLFLGDLQLPILEQDFLVQRESSGLSNVQDEPVVTLISPIDTSSFAHGLRRETRKGLRRCQLYIS